MIKLVVDGAELEVWRTAASTMPSERVTSLLPDLWQLARDGFPGIAPTLGDADLIHYVLSPTFGAYEFVDGQLRAMTGAETFDLTQGRLLYFSLSAIHSSLRGRGLYEQMLLLRVAYGHVTGCRWWATRTQSPIVAHSFTKFGCYPWVSDDATSAVAVQVGGILYDKFQVQGTRAGQVFDPTTGVLHGAYPMNPYDTIPTVVNDDVHKHFEAHVDREAGDALLLVGPLDDAIDALAPRCDAHFGISFDQLCVLLTDL